MPGLAATSRLAACSLYSVQLRAAWVTGAATGADGVGRPVTVGLGDTGGADTGTGAGLDERVAQPDIQPPKDSAASTAVPQDHQRPARCGQATESAVKRFVSMQGTIDLLSQFS